MELTTIPNLPALLACIFVLYIICIGVYRLYFSPLAKFPGPRLAALTLWYEFYYDVIKHGRYTWRIAEMHQQYGPIVRINPNELHIDDPEYYDELYVGSSRRTMKYEWAMKGFGPTISSFATEGHELHRTRRGALAPYFSKASVYQLEPTVQSVVNKLVSRLEAIRGSGTVINVIDVFTALTADIIGEYAFALPYDFIDNPDFAPHWYRVMMDFSETFHMFKQFGWMEPLVRKIPQGIVKIISPQLGALFTVGDMAKERIARVKAELAEGKKPDEKTIFYDMLTNDQLRPEDKTSERLEAEGASVLAAGSVTTAHMLSLLTFLIVDNTEILTRLQKELHTVMPRPDSQPKWNQLEQLPYLTAIIQEGLRWGYGITHRLQRISPDVALQYDGWTIPPGIPVSMTSILMHDNQSLFPNPRLFSPERWLQPDSAQLRKYLVTFSKGSRQCLGMNLAYCELYLTLAAIFAPGRFSFEMFETDISDVEIAHDFFIPCERMDSKGIRVLVK